jgi:hypothetical protein
MKKIFYLLFSTACLISACKKIEVPMVDMEVQLQKSSYKVNDTVNFDITGDVQNIVFYAGEELSNYDNAGKITIDKGKTQLDFRTVLGGGKRDNSLKVLVTTGLATVNAASIASASWIDITSRVILASTAATASGPVDITEFADPDKPFRLAFQYQATTSSTLAQPIWNISSFSINTTYNDGTIVPITSLANALWTQVDIKNPANVWTIASNQVRIDGGAKGNADNEDWVVTGQLDLQATRERTDFGKSIKNLASSPINSYQHIYTKPGTYTATFVGFNNSIDDNKKVIKKFTVVVTN